MTREPVNAAGKLAGGEEPMRYTVLSRRTIAAWAALIVVTGVGAAVWLLAYGAGGDPRLRLEAIRTVGTVVVGAGSAARAAARRPPTTLHRDRPQTKGPRPG